MVITSPHMTEEWSMPFHTSEACHSAPSKGINSLVYGLSQVVLWLTMSGRQCCCTGLSRGRSSWLYPWFSATACCRASRSPNPMGFRPGPEFLSRPPYWLTPAERTRTMLSTRLHFCRKRFTMKLLACHASPPDEIYDLLQSAAWRRNRKNRHLCPWCGM